MEARKVKPFHELQRERERELLSFVHHHHRHYNHHILGLSQELEVHNGDGDRTGVVTHCADTSGLNSTITTIVNQSLGARIFLSQAINNIPVHSRRMALEPKGKQDQRRRLPMTPHTYAISHKKQ
jgi:hypothetical protein